LDPKIEAEIREEAREKKKQGFLFDHLHTETQKYTYAP